MEPEYVSWAHAYQSLLNEPYIRQQLVQLPQQLGFYTFSQQNWEVNGDKGTLYYELGEEGHFMAYSRLDDYVLVYDPSWPDGNYAPRTQRDKQAFYRDLNKAFDGIPWQIYVPDGRPVQAEFDTWCQTWSLAWLDPELQGSVYQAQSNPQDVADILHDIVVKVCHRLRAVRVELGDRRAKEQVIDGFFNALANWDNFWLDEDIVPTIRRRLF